MKFASRGSAFAVLAALALAATGCSSNNKGKIEGKWKFVSFPEKATTKNKDGMADLGKMGLYIYIEFAPGGAVAMGVGADDPKTLDLMKAMAPNQQMVWNAKYKLLSGDLVELYDLPKDVQNQNSSPFGKKDRAKVKIVINGDDMKMTDDDGTATLAKVK